MKKVIHFSTLIIIVLVAMVSCQETSYPGATISPYVSLYDLRLLHKEADVQLDINNMYGSNKITGVVISDHTHGNLPEGYLILQDKRRLDKLRGITIPLGADATKYTVGDSVIINIEGKTLARREGILQIIGVSDTDIELISRNRFIAGNRVNAGAILANPNDYESTRVAIVKAGFDPLPKPTDVLSGDKIMNDGFGDIVLKTLPSAAFSNAIMPISANYYGIILNEEDSEGNLKPHHRMVNATDLVLLSSEVEIAPILITGFVSDAKGTDANYEYIQLMATEDIDFSVTPYALVTTNNAGASTPTGYPLKGWATGDVRTYKFNLTTGTAKKGEFFYVGGTSKMINGPSSTSINDANWICSYAYNTQNGFDFGTKTTNLLANSGNAFGMAVFKGTKVDVNSKPVDVIFIATGGSLYTEGPPAYGYKITNTDFYDVIDPLSLNQQPYYRNGTNTLAFKYNTSDVGYFNMLGGVYNPALGKWIKARAQNNVLLTKESVLLEIEGEGSTQLK